LILVFIRDIRIFVKFVFLLGRYSERFRWGKNNL